MHIFVTALFVSLLAVLVYRGQDIFGGATAQKITVKSVKLGTVKTVNQHFHKTNNKGVNKLIVQCLVNQYQYLAMSNFFNRGDVALPGFQKYFMARAEDEMKRAQTMMEYVNKRGGEVRLFSIKAPWVENYGDGITALKRALHMERAFNNRLLVQHNIASVKKKDAHLKFFLEHNLIDEQVEIIKQLGDYITRLESVTSGVYKGLGLYTFDLDLQK